MPADHFQIDEQGVASQAHDKLPCGTDKSPKLIPPRNLATGLTSTPPRSTTEGIDQCYHTEEQHCECIAAYCKISNRGNQQNRSGEDPVLRCELSQLFPIEEDQASSDKIDCTVQNICPCAEIYCCSRKQHPAMHGSPHWTDRTEKGLRLQ